VPRRSRRSDALDQALEEAERRAARSSPDEIFHLGKSKNTRDRLLALRLARRRMELGDPPRTYFQFARDLIRDPDKNCRWQAIIVIGESLETDPDAVWEVAREFGDDPDSDMRMAVATCLLEHLLDQNFDAYFPLVREEILNGRSRMIDTLSSCWFGERDGPNFKKMQAFVRNSRRGRSDEG
jgi:hypothetical protein